MDKILQTIAPAQGASNGGQPQDVPASVHSNGYSNGSTPYAVANGYTPSLAPGSVDNGHHECQPVVIHVASFVCLTNTHATFIRLNLAELRELLTTHDIRPGKDGALWSPTIYRDGATSRKNESVEFLTALVADCDESHTLAQVEAIIARLGVWAVLYSSHRHGTPEKDGAAAPGERYRVVFPLAQPVPVAQWPDVWERLNLLFDGELDASCKDESRAYYLPSHPTGDGTEAKAFEGHLITPDDLPELPADFHTPHFAPAPPVAAGEGRPGDDYNEQADNETVAALLENYGCKVFRSQSQVWRVRRPGKNGPGISATLGYHGPGILHNFSSNFAPFEAGHAYRPFSVLTLLQYDGDFSAAAGDLAADGYGAPLPSPPAPRLKPGGGKRAGDMSSLSFMSLPDSAEKWPDAPGAAAYHGLAGEIVCAIEPHTEADPVALLIQLLVAFGNAIGRTAYFTADGARHYMNLFAVLVGVSSKGRKGSSWAHIGRLLAEVDPEWATSRILGGLSSGEGVIWNVRDPITKQEAIKEKGRPTGEYVEVTTDFGIDDKRLLIQESEFAGVLKVMGRDGSTLSATLRQAWDNGTLRILNKNSPAQATDAHISIIGHITQDELTRYLDATESANGFGNRFLWLCVKRSKLLPDGGGQANLDGLTGRLHAAIEFARRTEQMSRDDEARALWHAVYPELSEGKPGLFGAIIGRAEAQTMRLAALFALLDRSAIIRQPHLEAALALWKYCEDSARYVFGEAMGDPVADEILCSLRRAYPKGLTLTDISHGLFHRNQKAERIGAALTTLLEAGRVRCEKRQTNGRPADVWFAKNPP